jgi:hypothetical protein
MSTNDPSEPGSFEPPRADDASGNPPDGAPRLSEPGDTPAEPGTAPSAEPPRVTPTDPIGEPATPPTESSPAFVTSDTPPAPRPDSEPGATWPPATEQTTTTPAETAAAAAAGAAAGTAATAPPTSVLEPTPGEATTAVPVVTAPTAPVRRKTGTVKVLGILIIVAGVILMAAGATTWFLVRDELADEKITVSDDADWFAGDPVDGPLTAYSEADTIQKHALEASGGLTYAQLPQGDPKRDTVMTASFLRASLYTSVVSFGVAAFAFGIGIVLILIGWALLRVAKTLRTV